MTERPAPDRRQPAPRDPGGFHPRILPPFWAAGIAGCMYATSRLAPWGRIPWEGRAAGGALVAAGCLLALWTAALFVRRRTSIEPGRVSTTLLTRGPFRFTRNPIYLGMALTLLGGGMWLGQISALWAAPAFVAVISRRFIRHEERMLLERFGDAYAAYCRRVRRWL